MKEFTDSADETMEQLDAVNRLARECNLIAQFKLNNTLIAMEYFPYDGSQLREALGAAGIDATDANIKEYTAHAFRQIESSLVECYKKASTCRTKSCFYYDVKAENIALRIEDGALEARLIDLDSFFKQSTTFPCFAEQLFDTVFYRFPGTNEPLTYCFSYLMLVLAFTIMHPDQEDDIINGEVIDIQEDESYDSYNSRMFELYSHQYRTFQTFVNNELRSRRGPQGSMRASLVSHLRMVGNATVEPEPRPDPDWKSLDELEELDYRTANEEKSFYA